MWLNPLLLSKIQFATIVLTFGVFLSTQRGFVCYFFIYWTFDFMFSGSDSRTKQTLLLHHHQLQEKWAGAKGLRVHSSHKDFFECFEESMRNITLIILQMLLNLHKKSWMEGLTLQDYSEHCKLNETIVKEMLELAKNYNKVQRSDHIHNFIIMYLFINLKQSKQPAAIETAYSEKKCAFLHTTTFCLTFLW